MEAKIDFGLDQSDADEDSECHADKAATPNVVSKTISAPVFNHNRQINDKGVLPLPTDLLENMPSPVRQPDVASESESGTKCVHSEGTPPGASSIHSSCAYSFSLLPVMQVVKHQTPSMGLIIASAS